MTQDFKEYNLTVDIVNRKSPREWKEELQTVHFEQNDMNSAKLLIKITHGGNPYVIPIGAIVRMPILKPDKTLVYQGQDDEAQSVTITSAAAGEVSVILNTQSLAAVGDVQAQLEIYLLDDKTLVTSRFAFKVDESIMSDNVLESNNDFSVLKNLLETVSGDPNLEVTNARTAKDGTVHTNLKAHTDSIHDKIGIFKKNQVDISDYANLKTTTVNGDDWTPAINAALDVLRTAGGGKLILSDMFPVTQKIVFNVSNVNIEGKGNKTGIAVYSNQVPDGTRVSIENCENVTLSNVLIKETNATTTRSNVYGSLALNNVKNVTLDNVEVTHSNGAGIHGIKAENVRLQKCYVHDTKADGIHFQRGSKNIMITNTVITQNEDDCIGFVSHDVGGYGYCQGLTVTNCILGDQQNNAVGSGVALIGSMFCTISNNVIRNTGLSGVRISDFKSATEGHAVPGNIVVSNNFISNCGLTTDPTAGLVRDGVTIANARNVTIANNSIQKAKNGVLLNQGGIEIVVKNNIIKNITERGIWAAALKQTDVGYLQLWDHADFSDGQTQTFVTFHSIDVVSNKLISTGKDGIYLDGKDDVTRIYNAYIYNNTIDRYNTASASGVYGVYAGRVDGITITKNYVTNKIGTATDYGTPNNYNAQNIYDNFPLVSTSKMYIGNKQHTYAGAAPTSGTYNLGDVVWNWNPQPNAYIGWVCTIAGSPGTWKGFGTIQA